MYVCPKLEQHLNARLKARVYRCVKWRLARRIVAVQNGTVSCAVFQQKPQQTLSAVHYRPVQGRPSLRVKTANARTVRQQRADNVFVPADRCMY